MPNLSYLNKMARGPLILFAGFLVFIFLSFPADAKLYQWTDENGKTHFTDDKTKIPQKYIQQIKERSSNNQKMVICEKELELGVDIEINGHNDSIAFLEKKIKAILKGKQGRSERIQKLSKQNILAKKKDKGKINSLQRRIQKNRESLENLVIRLIYLERKNGFMKLSVKIFQTRN